MPVSFFLLALVLIGAGILTCCIAIVLLAGGILRPPRMSDAKALYLMQRLSPGDLGLEFEEAWFDVRDERTLGRLRIAGWWFPAPNGAHEERVPGAGERCVVLIHGYADAKVGAITWAPPFNMLGFNVLAIDLRAHGESGAQQSTAGYFERHDVSQVIDQICAERPLQTRGVILCGISMGAGVALATAILRDRSSEASRVQRADVGGAIDAVVLESPIADFRHAAAAHIGTLGLPIPWLIRAALGLAERLSGARFDDVRPVDLIPKVRCPLLVISADADGVYLSPDDAMALEAAVRSRPAEWGANVFHHLPEAPHMTGVVADPEGYLRILRTFLEGVQEATEDRTSASATSRVG